MADVSKLMAEVNALVESRTFTAEAAGGIAKLRDRVLETEKLLERYQAEITAEKERGNNLHKQNEALIAETGFWQARKKQLEEREKKVTELEKDLAVANAKAAAFDTINQRMLANRIVREGIFHSQNIPIPMQGAGGSSGYVSTHTQTETKERTIEDKQ